LAWERVAAEGIVRPPGRWGILWESPFRFSSAGAATR
jgi:hypothetical protein